MLEYTVQKLAGMAGISGRTLRYYDEIGILKPARTSTSGYRVYGQAEVDRLQQILFYRELGVSLEEIGQILNRPSFDAALALLLHRDKLLEKRKQLDILIDNVEKSIACKEGRTTMSDREKFEGFKQKMIDDNEERYGKEAREKFGDEQVDASNQKLKELTPQQYAKLEKLSSSVMETLKAAMVEGDPSSDMAQKTADLHRQWLGFFWNEYSREAHAGLARMYVDDERFRQYYDQVQVGAAMFLRDAILIYTGMDDSVI